MNMSEQPEPATVAPAVSPPRWSGRKTAVVAALAITLTSAGTVGAAAALPQGTGASAHGGGMGGPPPGMTGGPMRGQMPQGQMPQGQSQQGQMPQGGMPGTQQGQTDAAQGGA